MDRLANSELIKGHDFLSATWIGNAARVMNIATGQLEEDCTDEPGKKPARKGEIGRSDRYSPLGL